jgi:hypothetical protein
MPDGTEAQSGHFVMTLTSQGMEVSGESWIDERGVLLKSVLRALFGMVETALVSLKRE